MKKLICLLLALAMMLGCLAACGSDSGKSSSAPSSSVPSKEESTPSSKADEGSGEESDPKEANEGGKLFDEPVTLDLFIDIPWFWLDKWGTDEVSQKITELTNMSFNVTRETDPQEIALMINSDDLPDLVYVENGGRQAMLSDPDVCYSYNELVERTGVDIHANETVIKANTAADGNYYALLNAYTSQESIDKGEAYISGGARSLAYRLDIWEDIGSPEFNSIEDVEKALLACKEKYPDVIPLLPLEGNQWYFAEQMGLNGSGSLGYDKDGKPCHYLNMEGIQDYYKLLNRFYREGLITPESMTYGYDKYCEVRNSGKTFIQIRSADEAMTSNVAAKEAGTDYRWKLLTHDLSDNALVSVNTGIGWAGTFITKNCKDPESAIRFMSWARGEEGRKLGSWGIEGVHWEYTEDGGVMTTQSYRDGLANGKIRQNDFGVGVWIFGDQGDENSFMDAAATDPDQIDYYQRLRNGSKHTKVMSELKKCIPTEGDMQNLWNSLNDMCYSEVNKAIFAETEEECQAALDTLYQQAETMGLSKLNAWMAEQLN
ncbi:hypothetical protein [Acutalibacter intestini]|uniref:hypothetical protein n=1 Tax=Acutalibacter intestini TaxID=3093659 RepID=UPI002AC8ED91|nr:hypothetical protein [Acutalibacter sp. M00204]